MTRLGFVILSLAAGASSAVAAAARVPAPMYAKACCENCNVARFVPPGVPRVAPTMITGALLLESSLLGAGALAALVLRNRRRRPEPLPEAAPARV